MKDFPFESVAQSHGGTGTQGWRGAYHTRGRARNLSCAPFPRDRLAQKWEARAPYQARGADCPSGWSSFAQESLASPVNPR